MTFEKAIERLEEISTKLESGKLTLEESIKLYEEAVELCSQCKKLLDEGNGKITILREKLGGLFEEDFEE